MPPVPLLRVAELGEPDEFKANCQFNFDMLAKLLTRYEKAVGAFRGRRAANQTPTGGVWTKVTLATEDYDASGWFDNATNYRFTPEIAGYYQLQGLVNYNAAAGFIAVAIYKNGAVDGASSGADNNTGTNGSSPSISKVVYANGTTDYFELYTYTSAGTTSAAAEFSGHYIGGAF